MVKRLAQRLVSALFFIFSSKGNFALGDAGMTNDMLKHHVYQQAICT